MPFTFNGTAIVRLYVNYALGQTSEAEVFTFNTVVVHRRVVLTFNANGGTGGSSQTRTWGVENVTQPSNPTRTGYTFLGWATTSGASTPNVSFPFLAPSANTTYYAVWQLNQVQTTAPIIYDASTTTIRYYVKNNDASTATIYADHDQANPTTSRGSIAAGANTSTINTMISSLFGTATIYAKSQASGETMSTVTSLYIDP